MLALAGNFHFFGSRIAANIATVLFMSGNRAQARFVSTGLGFIFCHRSLLVGGLGFYCLNTLSPAEAGWLFISAAQPELTRLLRKPCRRSAARIFSHWSGGLTPPPNTMPPLRG
jgi:hypothetical protein